MVHHTWVNGAENFLKVTVALSQMLCFHFFLQKLDRRKFTFTENISNGQLKLCQYSQSISKSIFRIRLKKKGVKVKKNCGQWWNVESVPKKIKNFRFFCQKVAEKHFGKNCHYTLLGLIVVHRFSQKRSFSKRTVNMP